MKYFKKISIILFIIASQYSFSQKRVTKYEYQTLFIYNFAGLIQWPPNYKSGEFVIGILGNNPIHKELKSFTAKRKVVDQPIVIKKYNSVDDIKKCHILFVPLIKSNKIDDASRWIRKKKMPTLIVAEGSGAIARGAAISFVFINNKMKFKLKKNNATRQGLMVSRHLEKLAIVVQ